MSADANMDAEADAEAPEAPPEAPCAPPEAPCAPEAPEAEASP